MRIEAGLEQRIQALNLFLNDIYHEGRILADRVVPRDLVYSCRQYRREMRGVHVPAGAYIAVTGSDLIRLPSGEFAVLEDNLRVPSGVSYMLENRILMKSAFPELFELCRIQPVDGYTAALYDMLAALSPRMGERPVIALLTPGIFNSAYFEHSYLAQQIGAQLVQGTDLLVGSDDAVKVRINGREVWKNKIDRPLRPDDDRVPVELKKGPNTLLIKVEQGVGDIGFAVRFLDPDDELTFSVPAD